MAPGCFVWAPGVLASSSPRLVLCYVADVLNAAALVMHMDRRRPMTWIPLQGLRLALPPLPELMPDKQAIINVRLGACVHDGLISCVHACIFCG